MGDCLGPQKVLMSSDFTMLAPPSTPKTLIPKPKDIPKGPAPQLWSLMTSDAA